MGAEGMLRPAMHYRWIFDQGNADFLLFHFQTLFNAEDSGQAALGATAFIRENVNPMWGVTPKVHELIETYHETTLQKLNAHFALYPYFFRREALQRRFRNDRAILRASGT